MVPPIHLAAEHKSIDDVKSEAPCEPLVSLLDSGEPAMATTGRDLPSHLIRDLGPRIPVSNDPVSHQIARLLKLHPDVRVDYSGMDLRRLGPAKKRLVLSQILQRLGISQPPSRSLPIG